MFESSRSVTLDDGRKLTVQYAGERYGWNCLVLGGPRQGRGDSPLAAIADFLDLGESDLPAWVAEFSADYERALREVARFVCDCCGYRTLLSKGSYEICDVCDWEDDEVAGRAGVDTFSGPNNMTLREGRANFAQHGASDLRARGRVRDPKPEETVRPLVRNGDRFEVLVETERMMAIVRYAPAHSDSADTLLPKGSVLVANDESRRGMYPHFNAYPERYEELERILVPAEIRTAENYHRYVFTFGIDEIGALLKPIEPLRPRPGNLAPTTRPDDWGTNPERRRRASA